MKVFSMQTFSDLPASAALDIVHDAARAHLCDPAGVFESSVRSK
jgi:hypothetical protein